MKARILTITLLGLILIGTPIMAQEPTGFEKGVIDLGIDMEFYEEGQGASLRIDAEPFGIPVFMKLDPKIQTDSIMLDSITIGSKIPEPFGWKDFYAFGSVPIKFYEESSNSEETYLTTRFEPIKLGAGFKKHFWNNYKFRLEGLVQDPLDERKYIARFTLQYSF